MKNLLNLRWLHGSPNQTGETLTRENRLGIVTCLNPMRTLCITLFLLTLGTGQMWASKKVWIDVTNAPSGYTSNMRVQYYNSSYAHTTPTSYGTINGRTIYSADIPDGATKWEVHRGDDEKGSNDYNWQGELTYSSNNKYNVTGWDKSGSASNVIGMVRGGYIYFDNSVTDWTGNIQFVIGHSSYSRTYEMTQLTGTKIWYVNLTEKDYHEWPDATYYAFIASTDKVSDGSWESSSLSSKATKYTAAYTSKYNLDNGSTYWCVPSGSSNGSSFSISYKSGYSSIPTNTMTINVQTKVTGSSYGSSFNSPTAVTMQTRYLSNNGTSNTQSATVSTSAKSNTKVDVTTGQVDFSYTALDDDAQWAFDGWGTTDSETSSTSSTYRIDAGSAASKTATTIYAFFTRKPVLTVNCGSNGTSASGSATNNAKTTYNISATPASGYQFKEWTINSGSVTFGSSTSASTTATISADATITATFEEKTGGVITLSAGTGGQVSADNSVWGSTEYITDITTTTAKNIYAKANTGYTFSSWSKTSGSGSITSTSSASTTFTPVAYEDATVTASFNETMHTITIEGGTSASTTAGVATTGSATAADPATGKKFTGWSLGDGVTLSGGSLTDQTINFTATANATVTATYTDRSTKKVYFATPGGWDHIYAYVWNNSNGGDKNDNFPGVEITSNTEVVNCVTYYVYEYYDEPNGTGDAGHPDWDRVVFNKGTGDHEYPEAGWDKTKNLNIADGHFYRAYEDANSTGRTDGHDWYLEGTFNNVGHWDFSHPIDIDCETGIGYVDVADLTATSQSFKIYQASTNTWYSGDRMTVGVAATLSTPYNDNCTVTPAAAGTHRFTFNTGTKELTIRYAGADPDLSATIRTDGTNGASVSSVSILHQYTPTTITATVPEGYHFAGWTHDGSHGITFANASSATTTVTATSAGGIITANFTTDGFIYLDKSAIKNSWSGDVWVYFYRAAYWDNSNNNLGSGSKTTDGGTCITSPKRMTRIGDSQIYYYDYTQDGTINSNIKQYIAFTDKEEGGWGNFGACSAIYRGDFYPKMPMFVVKDWKEYHNTNACYYNQGYWRKYNDTDPGYVIKTYNSYSSAACTGTYYLRSDIAGASDCSVDIPLTSGTQYFKVLGCDTTSINGVNYAGTYYRDGGNGTMNTDNCTGWKLTDAGGSNTGVLATASADYKFTLTLGSGELFISVDFPLAVNDYRLVYNGKMRTTYSEKKDHPSNYIRRLKRPTVNNDTTRTDIISFYVDPSTNNAALKPEIRFQYCSAIVGYTVTWSDFANEQKIDLSGITKPGVYTFEIVQNNHKEGQGNHEIMGRLIGPYEGDYYIRTDMAAGGWKSYKAAEDNKMVYTHISKENSGYDYYYCNWIFNNNNVKFTIANDYSECVTDTVENDTYVTNDGKLSSDANVRFMYNDSTNFIGRAYINGSTYHNRYLVLTGDAKTFDKDGNAISASGGLNANEMEFEDMGNWVYQEDLRAKSGSKVSVTATYRGNIQTFINNQTLITSTDNISQFPLRTVYDFKTNQLIAAWLPDGTISEDMDVTADVMLIRSGQKAANQIQFNSSAKITGVQKIVGAIEFCKDSIVGRVGSFSKDVIGSTGNRTYREMMMYISFPFDVAVQDIFGAGQFNKEWYLQYYDGAERAEKGFFRGDGTTTFWKFMNFTDTLRANVGYSLLLDNDYFNTDGQGVWKNIADGGKVYLYFPSAKELDGKVIKSETASITVPSHECKIDREFESASADKTVNHKFTDSHWNMIGLPIFENQTGMETTKFKYPVGENVTDALEADNGYFYEWDSINNAFGVKSTSGYVFKAMHGYMVQFTGDISFTGSSIQPASIVAARKAPQKENYMIELEMLFNGSHTGRTYVELREEADEAFLLNEDVYMAPTARAADIFTFAENYDVSANVLPIDNHIVPVGVEVHKAGMYTFTMPSNFSGTVELVDTFNGERTDLAMSDYSVYLEKGYQDGRFLLEINVNKVSTAIDGVSDGTLKDGKAHKFLQNGVMYILQNGVMYDAQGKRVK